MSLMLMLSEKSIVFATNYFPAIDLNDGDYELGLPIFETYHMIPNVNESNNKFYFRQRRGNYNSRRFVQSARHK